MEQAAHPCKPAVLRSERAGFSPSQEFPKAFARTVAVVAQRPSFCGHTTKAAFPAGIDSISELGEWAFAAAIPRSSQPLGHFDDGIRFPAQMLCDSF
jgi:hypothetical protein